MYSQQQSPPALKRSFSGDSQNSYASHASQATTASRASSRLLFGEIPLTPATTTDGRSMRSNGSICNLVLSTSSVFLRFWLNDNCRDNMLAHMEPEDLASFRLVCHDMSTRAAPYLFESITTTFKSSSFSKPARIEALSRIGLHIKTFTFHMPHTPDVFLPPVVDPETGEEKQFVYEPQMQIQTGPAKDKTPKYGSWEMQDLLVKQYPPLFHAATNVPAFVAAFSELVSLTHLKVSCPGANIAPRHRRSVVDYALISLRIAVERAPLFSLSELSLHPIHAGGLLYLHPMHGFGSTPQTSKRWSQIRRLSICMESIDLTETTARARAQSLEHLRILHAYLRTLSRGVTRLFFRWKGERGPSPLSLDREPCMQPIDEEDTHPTMRGEGKGPRPLKFSRLRYMTLENAVMDSTQISDFIEKHRRSLVEFNFEDVKLRDGNWDDALEPLTIIAGNDYWKKTQEEVMDVPIMLSPIDLGPRIMSPLMEEVDLAIEEACGKERNAHTLSRWLTKPARSGPNPKKSPAMKDSFFGADHMKRFLRISSWK